MIGTSRRGTSSRMAQLVLFTSAFGLTAGIQAASLKDKPAKSVTLSGTEWRIDYVTTASGSGMPKVKIYRVYTLAPAQAAR